jgi:hypothetical protein
MSFVLRINPQYRGGNFTQEVAMRELDSLSVKIPGGAAELCLDRGQTLDLNNAVSTTIECESGVVWLTQYDDCNDVVLRAGESFVVDHDGLSIVQVFEDAKIRVTAPHTEHEAAVSDRFLQRMSDFVPAFYRAEVAEV